MSKEATAQGREAKKLELTEFDCPYGPGENRDAWMSGFGAKKEAVEDSTEDAVRAASASAPDAAAKTVRKGAKDAETKAVTKPTGNAETAIVTATESAKPEDSESINAEAVIGDPAASTTRAATDGDAGVTRGKKEG